MSGIAGRSILGAALTTTRGTLRATCSRSLPGVSKTNGFSTVNNISNETDNPECVQSRTFPSNVQGKWPISVSPTGPSCSVPGDMINVQNSLGHPVGVKDLLNAAEDITTMTSECTTKVDLSQIANFNGHMVEEKTAMAKQENYSGTNVDLLKSSNTPIENTEAVTEDMEQKFLIDAGLSKQEEIIGNGEYISIEPTQPNVSKASDEIATIELHEKDAYVEPYMGEIMDTLEEPKTAHVVLSSLGISKTGGLPLRQTNRLASSYSTSDKLSSEKKTPSPANSDGVIISEKSHEELRKKAAGCGMGPQKVTVSKGEAEIRRRSDVEKATDSDKKRQETAIVSEEKPMEKPCPGIHKPKKPKEVILPEEKPEEELCADVDKMGLVPLYENLRTKLSEPTPVISKETSTSSATVATTPDKRPSNPKPSKSPVSAPSRAKERKPSTSTESPISDKSSKAPPTSVTPCDYFKSCEKNSLPIRKCEELNAVSNIPEKKLLECEEDFCSGVDKMTLLSVYRNIKNRLSPTCSTVGKPVEEQLACSKKNVPSPEYWDDLNSDQARYKGTPEKKNSGKPCKETQNHPPPTITVPLKSKTFGAVLTKASKTNIMDTHKPPSTTTSHPSAKGSASGIIGGSAASNKSALRGNAEAPSETLGSKVKRQPSCADKENRHSDGQVTPKRDTDFPTCSDFPKDTEPPPPLHSDADCKGSFGSAFYTIKQVFRPKSPCARKSSTTDCTSRDKGETILILKSPCTNLPDEKSDSECLKTFKPASKDSRSQAESVTTPKPCADTNGADKDTTSCEQKTEPPTVSVVLSATAPVPSRSVTLPKAEDPPKNKCLPSETPAQSGKTSPPSRASSRPCSGTRVKPLCEDVKKKVAQNHRPRRVAGAGCPLYPTDDRLTATKKAVLAAAGLAVGAGGVYAYKTYQERKLQEEGEKSE